ncbi:MAG: carotenoid oxygenase family protein [Akkermansiaceae bacterium]|nr:carotenoid oxygenase family protein [Akkermansiaceae bacterium]
MSVCYDSERHVSEIVVLDASNISAGPVAWAELPIIVPHGLHGTWIPSM